MVCIMNDCTGKNERSIRFMRAHAIFLLEQRYDRQLCLCGVFLFRKFAKYQFELFLTGEKKTKLRTGIFREPAAVGTCVSM